MSALVKAVLHVDWVTCQSVRSISSERITLSAAPLRVGKYVSANRDEMGLRYVTQRREHLADWEAAPSGGPPLLVYLWSG